MKFTLVGFVFLAVVSLRASPLDDVVDRLDRHGLWRNGSFQPVHEPADASEETLVAHFLAISGRASLKIEILQKKEISPLKINMSEVRAVYVRSERMIIPPEPKRLGPEYCVILFHFSGQEWGWWSRVYPVKDGSELK